jgi:Aspartyl protease
MSRTTLASASSLILLASLACLGQTSQTSSAPRSATVPFHLEDNRVFVDLTFTKPDGSPRTARFWVDTGGGGFLITEPLARDLGLDLSGTPMEGEGRKFLAVTPPPARLGNLQLDLKDAEALVVMEGKTIQPGFSAEGLFPGHVLERYQVVIDYATRQFTLALPGTLKMQGTRLNTPVQKRSGFPRLEITVAGKPYGFLLDCGAAYTMISQDVLDTWAKAHPEWPHATGAVGAANMIGRAVEVGLAVTRVPEMELGALRLKGAGMVARPKGVFENGMSPLMTAPIAGALGGNVLRNYRVQIDYAEGATYLEQTSSPGVNDLDVVGLILQAQPDGSFTVIGIAQKDGKPVLEGVEEKDKLVKIEGADISGKTLPEVLQALQGKPGEVRRLVFERNGKPVTIAAPVIHLL